MPPMDTFIAVCLALIVLELGVCIAVAVTAMLRIMDAARAVEIAAYRVDQEVLELGEGLRSGWGSAFRTMLSAGLTLFRRPS